MDIGIGTRTRVDELGIWNWDADESGRARILGLGHGRERTSMDIRNWDADESGRERILGLFQRFLRLSVSNWVVEEKMSGSQKIG